MYGKYYTKDDACMLRSRREKKLIWGGRDKESEVVTGSKLKEGRCFASTLGRRRKSVPKTYYFIKHEYVTES